MALVEKIGNQYRQSIGTSDHHEMWQMLPAGWEPGPNDQVVGEEAMEAAGVHVESHMADEVVEQKDPEHEPTPHAKKTRR
jgi:hypothetical protein